MELSNDVVDLYFHKLINLQQSSTVESYEHHFKMLHGMVVDKYWYIVESYFVDCCVQGFIKEIKEFVQSFSPSTLEWCFKIAKWKEFVLTITAASIPEPSSSNKVTLSSYDPINYSGDVIVHDDECNLDQSTDFTITRVLEDDLGLDIIVSETLVDMTTDSKVYFCDSDLTTLAEMNETLKQMISSCEEIKKICSRYSPPSPSSSITSSTAQGMINGTYKEAASSPAIEPKEADESVYCEAGATNERVICSLDNPLVKDAVSVVNQQHEALVVSNIILSQTICEVVVTSEKFADKDISATRFQFKDRDASESTASTLCKFDDQSVKDTQCNGDALIHLLQTWHQDCWLLLYQKDLCQMFLSSKLLAFKGGTYKLPHLHYEDSFGLSSSGRSILTGAVSSILELPSFKSISRSLTLPLCYEVVAWATRCFDPGIIYHNINSGYWHVFQRTDALTMGDPLVYVPQLMVTPYHDLLSSVEFVQARKILILHQEAFQEKLLSQGDIGKFSVMVKRFLEGCQQHQQYIVQKMVMNSISVIFSLKVTFGTSTFVEYIASIWPGFSSRYLWFLLLFELQQISPRQHLAGFIYTTLFQNYKKDKPRVGLWSARIWKNDVLSPKRLLSVSKSALLRTTAGILQMGCDLCHTRPMKCRSSSIGLTYRFVGLHKLQDTGYGQEIPTLSKHVLVMARMGKKFVEKGFWDALRPNIYTGYRLPILVAAPDSLYFILSLPMLVRIKVTIILKIYLVCLGSSRRFTYCRSTYSTVLLLQSATTELIYLLVIHQETKVLICQVVRPIYQVRKYVCTYKALDERSQTSPERYIFCFDPGIVSVLSSVINLFPSYIVCPVHFDDHIIAQSRGNNLYSGSALPVGCTKYGEVDAFVVTCTLGCCVHLDMNVQWAPLSNDTGSLQISLARVRLWFPFVVTVSCATNMCLITFIPSEFVVDCFHKRFTGVCFILSHATVCLLGPNWCRRVFASNSIPRILSRGASSDPHSSKRSGYHAPNMLKGEAGNFMVSDSGSATLWQIALIPYEVMIDSSSKIFTCVCLILGHTTIFNGDMNTADQPQIVIFQFLVLQFYTQEVVDISNHFFKTVRTESARGLALYSIQWFLGYYDLRGKSVNSRNYAARSLSNQTSLSIFTKRSEVVTCQYAQLQVSATVFISMRQQVGDSTLLDWVWRLAWIMMATCGVVPTYAARLIQVDTRPTLCSLMLQLLNYRGEYISLTVGLYFNHLATAQVCRLVCVVISSSGDSPFMIWAWRLLIGIGTLIALLWRIAWHIPIELQGYYKSLSFS